MAITKEQVLVELKSLNQLFNDGTRRLLTLMMQVQNMPEVAQFPQMGSASATAQPGLSFNGAHPHDRSGHTEPVITQAGQAAAEAAAQSAKNASESATQVVVERAPSEAFVPQFNTQDVVNEALAQRFGKVGGPLNNGMPQGEAIVAEVLANAKDLLKQVLRDGGLPEQLQQMVDKVGVEDILKRRGPTEVVEEEVSPLLALVGIGSVFVEYLHEDAINHGSGEIKPKFIEEVKKYSQDALRTEIDTLRHYPTGFYTNGTTKALQFYVKTDQFLAVVDGLPSEVAPLYVHFLGDERGFVPAQNFLASELQLIHAKLQMALSELVKKKG